MAEDHSFQCVHHPLVGGEKSSKEKEIQTNVSEGDGVKIRMSGVHYPLEDRTLKEIRFKHSLNIYNKVFWVNLNYREN